MTQAAPGPPEGLLVLDKPGGWTSHDVVARVRRLAGTRRVGHAGTLDPMATGVLVLGVGRATRLLGHLSATDKRYLATIRLGCATTTDDAQGEPTLDVDASHLDDEDIIRAMDSLTGPIDQVPSTVSAIKVAGERAYRRARAGEDVVLVPRPVVVTRFDRLATRRAPRPDGGTYVEVDVDVECSTGTYVRALARDLGRSLDVGGHLTALRRTRVGRFTLDQAAPLDDDLDPASALLPLGEALVAAFPCARAGADARADIGCGRPVRLDRLEALAAPPLEDSLLGVLGEDGTALALMRVRGGDAVPVAVLAPAGGMEG
jgi:tRNA pseudouridine55 synthase